VFDIMVTVTKTDKDSAGLMDGKENKGVGS